MSAGTEPKPQQTEAILEEVSRGLEEFDGSNREKTLPRRLPEGPYFPEDLVGLLKRTRSLLSLEDFGPLTSSIRNPDLLRMLEDDGLIAASQISDEQKQSLNTQADHIKEMADLIRSAYRLAKQRTQRNVR